MTQNIMTKQTATTLVENHDRVQALVSEGLEKLSEAVRIMHATCATHHNDLLGSALHYNLTNFELRPESIRETKIDVKSKVLENFWQTAMTMIGLRDTMGSKEREAYDKQFKEHDLPAFDLKNIYSTLEGVLSGHPERIESLVREVFDWLRPRPHHGGCKTNQRAKVGKRVILSSMVSESMSGLDWCVYRCPRDMIHDLDKVFHLLDGQGMPKPPNDAVTAINEALRQREKNTQTQYFAFKWFKNRRLHVEFLRPDILAELNRIGAGGRYEVGT